MGELKKQTVSGIKWLVGSSSTVETSAFFFAHHVIYYLKKILRKEGGCPILAYHKINDRDINDKYAVGVKDFEQQMEFLFKRGFRTISLAEYLSFVTNHRRIPPKYFVLTFDDGYEDFYLNAMPILKKYNFKATEFIVANLVGKENEWDIKNGYPPTRLMDWVQIKETIETGMEIGSHSLKHLDLRFCPQETAEKEIRISKEILENKLGKEVRFFCYPHGGINDRIRDMVAKNRYSAACSFSERTNGDIFMLPRINVKNTDTGFAVFAKLCGTYYKLKDFGFLN